MNEFEQITRTGNGLKVLAPAKINLSLLVAGERPDGFHELETIMAKVTLFDELLIEPAEKDRIEVICTGCEWGPDGKDNLVYTACENLFEAAGRKAPLKITINKNIPAGAGLGSASTDAAAALIGVNKLFELGLSCDKLCQLAERSGSDITFFLGGPLAFCTGKGEKIQKIEADFSFSAILVLPDINCSTTKVYANYKHDDNQYKQLHGKIRAELSKNRIEKISKMCTNMLQVSSFGLYPELAKLKAQIESLNIRPLCMSGSGCSMYHILESYDGGQAEEYLRKITKHTVCKCILIKSNRW
ncbi:MAG: 4-(cytidine 5'-diphospho)-2-C-methyl-D-erythritol kinase [Sedimentisphaerales bacterium]|nr:4-(cytidine 5'-diphospho)-2-C-methyl-D-erythritol kinase [Sedimentisphaerales bacterium]